MKRLVLLLTLYLVPVALVVAFFVVQTTGVVRWLPVAPEIERDWGHYALLLGVIAAVFAAGWYDEREYGLPQFLLTVLVAVAMTLPVMMAPFAREFGIAPDTFALLSRATYVGFHVANGFLFGGAWTFVAGRIRSEAAEA
jgi:hypothetical protein